jgi:hypothetical protein
MDSWSKVKPKIDQAGAGWDLNPGAPDYKAEALSPWLRCSAVLICRRFLSSILKCSTDMTNIIQHSISLEDVSCWGSHEIPRIVWDLKFNYTLHLIPPLVIILSQINTVNNLTISFFMIQVNNALPWTYKVDVSQLISCHPIMYLQAGFFSRVCYVSQ